MKFEGNFFIAEIAFILTFKTFVLLTSLFDPQSSFSEMENELVKFCAQMILDVFSIISCLLHKI